MLKKLTKHKQRGALFIEYALILAFIVVIGVFFIGKNDITDNIKTIFNATSSTLNQAANPDKTDLANIFKKQTLTNGYWTTNVNGANTPNVLGKGTMLRSDSLIELTPGNSYTLSFDNTAVDSSLYANMHGLAFMLYTKDAAGNYVLYDDHAYVNFSKDKMASGNASKTYDLTNANTTVYLGVNTEMSVGLANRNPSEYKNNFQTTMQNGLVLTKNSK